MEFESFIGLVRTSGGSSLEVTIPEKICKFSGIKEGDTIKVMVQKVEMKKEE